MRILILEDNRDIAESVGEYFEMNEHQVDYAMDGLTALHLAVTNDYDVYIFDVGVPGIDGLTLCERLRNDTNDQTPIIFLTARDTLEDKVKGFDKGGDDYIVKPFQLKELLARAKAVFKRTKPIQNNIISIEDLVINRNTREVFRDSQKVTLTPAGYQILVTLAEASPNIVTRAQLENIMWKDLTPSTDSLKSHLYALRQKLDKPFQFPLIHTISKQGFRLYRAS